MFVNDVLLFVQVPLTQWKNTFHIISNFGAALGLFMNNLKSLLIYVSSKMDTIAEIANIFGVTTSLIELGFF